jgi:hypothetical protein
MLAQQREDGLALAFAMAAMAKDMMSGDSGKSAEKDSSSKGHAAPAPVAVFINGATGFNAANINGLFEPSQDKSMDGRILYKKNGDESKIIEHFEGKWQMKSATSKGKNSCCASVGGGCALEACVAAVWNVLDSGKWGNQTNVKMWTGAEAEAQASSVDARAHTSADLPCPSLCALSRPWCAFLRALLFPPHRRPNLLLHMKRPKPKFWQTTHLLLRRIELQEASLSCVINPAAPCRRST